METFSNVGIPMGTNFAPLVFISRFGFKSGICLLIAPVPVHCFSITFISRVLVVVQCGGPKKSPRTSI